MFLPRRSTVREPQHRPERTDRVPWINYDDIDKVRGLMIAIVTTAETDEEAYELLKLMGMPFRS